MKDVTSTQDATSRPPTVHVTATSTIADGRPVDPPVRQAPHLSWSVVGVISLALYIHASITGWGGILALPIGKLSWADVFTSFALIALACVGLNQSSRLVAGISMAAAYAAFFGQVILLLRREAVPSSHVIHLFGTIVMAVVMHSNWTIAAPGPGGGKVTITQLEEP